MTRIITAAEIYELWSESLQKGEVAYHSDGFDSVEKWKHRFGKECCREIQLRPGLWVDICEFENKYCLSLEFQHAQSFPLTLAFQISGSSQVLTEGIKDDYYHERAGENYLFFVAGTREIEEFPAQERLLTVRIRVEPCILRTFSAGQLDSLPCELQPFIKGEEAPLFHRLVGKITPAMQVALHQILNCPYQGLMKRTYLEGKVLELIALQFTQLVESDKGRSRKSSLRPSEIDRIHHAKEILIRHLENPPSLLDLARQVGLNDCTLKRGFRQVFGTTVFGYLHDYRMEQARLLLEENKLTITGVAHAIGFASRSYFAAAFRDKFGVNPGQYLAQSRNRDV